MIFTSVAVCCVSTATVFAVATPEDGWSDVSIANHLIGDEFTVPTRTYYQNGTEYTVTHSVTKPDGKSITSDELTLDKAGLYKISYIARSGNSVKTKTESFKANYPLVSKTDESSEIRVMQAGDYSLDAEAQGLYFRMQQGDTAEFNAIINIDKNSNKDVTLLSYFITPDVLGAADFRTLKFKFTDVTDENNYLVISAGCVSTNSTDGWAVGHTYYLAGGNGQTLKGVEGSSNLHEDDGYGRPLSNKSFYGLDVNKNPLKIYDSRVTFAYNPATQEVKADGQVIVDLDSNDHYGKVTDVKWKGFKSGNVKLTVYTENYNEASANFVISSLKDVDLGLDYISDEVAPEITVDGGYAPDGMPEARVGGYYAVPSATAFDYYSGVCEVTVKAYSDYNSSAKKNVKIEDGKFLTATKGQYAIVYTATDAFGNTATSVYWVHCGSEVAPITAELPEGRTTEIDLGLKAIVKEPIVSGGSGDLTVKTFVSFGSDKKELTLTNGEGYFVPDKSGEWTVTYVVTDYTGESEEFTYTVTAKVPAKPSFDGTPALPAVMVNGFNYTLPSLNVIDYTSGTLKTGVATVKFTDKNGEKTLTSNLTVTPAVAKNGDTVTVVYEYAFGGSTVKTEEYEIPVIFGYEDKKLSIENYFYSPYTATSYDLDKTGNGLVFTVKDAETTEWTFANPLAVNGFGLSLKTDGSASNFKAFTITLADYNDAGNTATIKLQQNGGYYYVKCGSVNEKTKIAVSADTDIDISIKGGRIVVNNVSYALDEEIAFDKAHLKFSLEDASVGAKYAITAVGNQPISDSSRDRTEPIITVGGNYGGSYKVGSTYYVHPAFAYDIISPEVECTLTVTDEQGNPVKDVNGRTIENVDPSVGYNIVLANLGQYKVYYLAADKTRGNEATLEYEVFAADDVAPEIKFSSTPSAKAKVGSLVALPSYTVKDDVTAAKDIVVEITVLNPNGRIIVPTKNAIKVEYEGVYEIRYVAYDEAGNTTLKTFFVNVTK